MFKIKSKNQEIIVIAITAGMLILASAFVGIFIVVASLKYTWYFMSSDNVLSVTFGAMLFLIGFLMIIFTTVWCKSMFATACKQIVAVDKK